MRGDSIATGCEDSEFSNLTDRNLITSISGSLLYLSGENRAERRKQKLREEIVREHIEKEKQKPSIRWSIVSKLMRS